MNKRLVWLIAAFILPMISLLMGLQGTATAVAPPLDLIINEWSQGPSGSKEWVELLVVNGPIDLRGWDLGDNSPGDLTFSNDTFWSNVPQGSLIIIYNGNDLDPLLPPEDTDLSDCTAVLPHNNTTYFSGGWPAFANTTDSDNPHLRDGSDATIHDFSVDPGTALHPTAQKNVEYHSDTAVGVSNPANWSNEAASSATPGSGNNITNTTWINTLCLPPAGQADVAVTKTGPATAVASSTLTYTLGLSSLGQHTATNVLLTDTLPLGLSYVNDDSGFPLSQPNPQTLVWQVGDVPTSTNISFQLITFIDDNISGTINNDITATTSYTETNTNNNSASAATTVSSLDADIAVTKTGPATAVASSTLTYTLSLSNLGQHLATDVLFTDTLPLGLSYVSDSSGLPLSQPAPQTLVWQVGDLPASANISFQLITFIDSSVLGTISNHITATTSYTEANTGNNSASTATTVSSNVVPNVLLTAVLYDGYENNDDDEAVAIRNMGQTVINIGDWQLGDGGSGSTSLPPGTLITPGQTLWLTKKSLSFQRQFGFVANFEATETDPNVPNLTSTWPGFANTGDKVILRDGDDTIMDVLLYGDEVGPQTGWLGTAVQPYSVSSLFASEGQILYRRRDQHTGLPVPDSNRAADWAQSLGDVVSGRKVRYPGWDLDEFFFTKRVTETAVITIAIAPDNAYQAIVNQINSAQTSLQIESHTFENLAIAEAIVAASQRGVGVTVLLEGAPPGGLPDQQKYICQQIETASGQCWFMISDDTQDIFDRYRYIHAKFLLVDGQRVIISSENLSPNSLPDDDKSDGTFGRRGVVLITDAAGVVSHVQTIFNRDFDTANHVDLFRWNSADPTYGLPDPGFTPITVTGGTTYTVQYPTPATFTGKFGFELVQSPENALRDVDALLGLIGRAGSGDTLWVEQLSERPYWGETNSNASDDPNPRLEAYIAAARRGANVHILLDEFFDSTTNAVSNENTCLYVNTIALVEKLKLECALNNPTGLGIHNKMVLAHINGQGYIHIGSINGTEQSNKGNRELALQVQSDEAYELLASMFIRDWPHRLYLPVMYNSYIRPAEYILIGEVLYNPSGATDDSEFIELVNPTGHTIDLSGYGLGDAVNPTDFEDVRRFPAGTTLAANNTLVVATAATAYHAEYNRNPDFEILDSDPTVPNLIDDPAWGDPAALLQLGNGGDEVILRNPANVVIDAIAYGTGQFPGVVACPVVTLPNASLERFPYWRDTNNCATDFREWPFPNPGELPEE